MKHHIPSITQQPHHRSQYPSFSPSLLYKNLLLCHRESDSLHTDSRGSNHLAQKLSSTPTSSNRSSSSFLSHTNSSNRELSFSSAGICSFFFQPGPVHASKTLPLPRQVNFPSPSFYFRHLRFLLHAEHSFCMQEDGGKIIPPVGFLCWARLILDQPCLPGRVWPRREISDFCWAEIGPTHFGAKSGPVRWAGPAQPNYILCIMYIILCFVLFISRYIYIYIYIYIYRKIN